MDPERRYSKPSGFYFDARREYFSDSRALLAKARSANDVYARQPPRMECKLCNEPLPPDGGFTSHRVGYIPCSVCTHLNGRHEDTRAFWEAMYVEGDGDYAELYLASDFDDRVRDIYLPKADFLVESLPEPDVTSLLDIGCGAGFFVEAALQRGLNAHGIDVNPTMVRLGNDAIERRRNLRPIELVKEMSLLDHMQQSSASVLSAIGVIEHLRDLEAFFRAFRNSRFRFLYFSVPMFSLSAAIEHAFPEVAPRQLQSDHTHLFTEASLGTLYEKVGCRPIAEWRFGTDMMDLLRSLLVTTGENGATGLTDDLIARLSPCIDDLQSVLDRAHYCSEIHVLAQRT